MIAGKKISVVVPVYNEEKTVAEVLDILTGSQKLDEIICVNDGSTDGSFDKISRFKGKIKIITFKKNRGKGAALAKGVEKSRGEVVVFLDSDLINLRATTVCLLAETLINKKLDVVLGSIQNINKDYNLEFDTLTGQRAYWRQDLLPHLVQIKPVRLGVETYLNHAFKDKTTQSLAMACDHLNKYEKMPLAQAALAYVQEGVDIVREKIKIKGILTESINKQLDQIAKLTDLSELQTAVKRIENKYVRTLFEKYLKNYLKKVYAFVETNFKN